MRRFISFVFAFLLLSFAVPSARAAEIQNVRVSASLNQAIIDWDHLDDSIASQIEGYAIQWSKYQNKVVNNQPYQQLVNVSKNTLSIRSATFDWDEDVFLRVYTYVTEGRRRILNNGSKVLKFKFNRTGDEVVETEFLDANDPVIVSRTDSSAVFNFGKLGIIPYDTYANFSWSRPNVSKSDANGVVIVLSENEDLGNPVAEMAADLGITTGKIKGLKPETTYYARGFLYKNRAGVKERFGEGTKTSFRTQKAFTARQKSKLARLIKLGLVKDRALVTVTASGDGTTTDTTSTDTSEDTSTSTDSTSTTNTTTTTSTSSTSTGGETVAELESQIRDLEAQLVKLKARLRSLKGSRSSSSRSRSTRSSSTSSTSTSSRSTRRSSGSSVQERLCKKGITKFCR